MIVTVAPCCGVSVIFTVNARRRWRRNAALPLAVRGTAKDTLPAFSDERTSRPTRTRVRAPSLGQRGAVGEQADFQPSAGADLGHLDRPA